MQLSAHNNTRATTRLTGQGTQKASPPRSLHAQKSWKKRQQRPQLLRAQNVESGGSGWSSALSTHGFGFSAGGLLFPYFQGVVDGVKAEGLMDHSTPVAGASAGSLIAACSKSGLTSEELLEALFRLAYDCRRLGTRKNLGPLLKNILHDVLPEDIHERCNSGNVHVAVTRLQGVKLQPTLLSRFQSRDDLINALLTSCHIPWYFAGTPVTSFRGAPHFDGGFTNFLPEVPGVENSVGVCCFPTAQLGVLAARTQMSPDAYEDWPYDIREMLNMALTPADDETLLWLMEKGRRDSLKWAAQYKGTAGEGGVEGAAEVVPSLVLPSGSATAAARSENGP